MGQNNTLNQFVSCSKQLLLPTFNTNFGRFRRCFFFFCFLEKDFLFIVRVCEAVFFYWFL